MDSNLAIALKNLSETIQNHNKEIEELRREVYRQDNDIEYKAEKISVLEKANSTMLEELRTLKGAIK